MTTERWVIECDGWQDYLRIADRPHYNVEKAITVEAWVTYRKQWWGAGFVSRGTTAGFKLIQNGNSGFVWIFRPRGISADHVNDTGPMLDELDKPKFAMDTWHHVAATYDGRVARTYFDGVLVKETTIEAPGIEWQSGDLFIGWAPNNNSSVGLDGRLAEVRIWKVARSEEEIRRDMQSSLTGKEAGLIGYWPLDEGDGTKVHDRTGYTNDGWLANGARWVKAALELGPPGATAPPPAGARPAVSAYSKAILADGPIAYWKLDETSGDVAHDSSGNEHHGAVKGAVRWGQPGAGPALASASFDGKTGYVEITDTKWGGGQELTVVAWAYLREVPADIAAIFGALDQSFIHCQISAENFVPAVYTNTSDHGLSTTGRSAPAGKWCHLALVAANLDVRAYVDGKLLASVKPGFSSIRPTGTVRIGSGYGSGRFFPGMISDVAVFGRALPTERILEYIEAAKVPAQPTGAGSAGPELEKRISDLEDKLAKCGDCCARIDALEKKIEPGAGGGAGPAPVQQWFGSEIVDSGFVDDYANRYWLDKEMVVPSDGRVTRFRVFAKRLLPVQLVLYRKMGDSYAVVGKSAAETPRQLGANEFSLSSPIAVKAGDVVGFHTPKAGVIAILTASGYLYDNLDNRVLYTPEGGHETQFKHSSPRHYAIAALLEAGSDAGRGVGPDQNKELADIRDKLAKCGDCCSKIEALEKALGGARRKPYVLFFDGKDDEVSFPSMDLDFSKGATVEAWVRWTNFQRFARILELSTGSSQNSIYLLNGESNNNLLWGVNRPDLEKSTQAQRALDTGKWMHLAATVDAAGNMAVYRDGKLVHTDKGKPPMAVVRTWNYISRSPWASDGRFHGQLTELRVWGAARTEAEIAAGMKKGLTGGEPGLQAYWPTDEGTGGILHDRTGRGHDGTILGATWQEVNDLPMEGVSPGSSGLGGGVDPREVAEIKDRLDKDLTDLEARLGKHLTDLEARLAKCRDCCNKVAALETRVGGAEGRLLAHDKAFAGVDQRLAEQDGKIAGNAVKIAEQDQKIAVLSGAMAMQDKKIATIDALDAEQEKKIAGAYAKVAEQDQKLVDLAERNAQQDTQLAEHTRQIADLAAKAAKCQDCADRLAVQQARIDDLVAQLGKHTCCDDKLAVLQARIDGLVAQLGERTGRDDKLAVLQARIDELSARAAKCQDCEETISGLKKVIDEQEKRIAKLEGQKGPEIIQPPPVWPPPGAPARLVVSYIHFIGAEKVSQGDEYIEIKNVGGTPQDIAGWRVRAGSAGQDFVFPAAALLEPGAALRVYTNHKEPGSFTFSSKKALWNDAGDTGQLIDASGKVVSELGYGTKETRTLESIKATYGVEKMGIVFDAAQVKAQKRKSDKMDFLTAVERAIRSLLEDPADQDRPNAANQVRDNWDGVPKDADAALLQQFIRDHMNKNRLRLLSEDSPEKTDLDVSTKDAWVFLLDKGMGDSHWVVVHRQGAEAAYQEIT